VLDDATFYTFHGTERFEVLAPLGHGGMGAVYRARDRERRMDVALKTLLSLNAEALVAFKREFRALQDLSHPNLVTMHELFSEGHDWFFTMELVEGIGFLGYVRRTTSARDVSPNAKTVRRVAELDGASLGGESWPGSICDEARLRACLPQLVLGLDALHAAGKVHRDVKPSNIMVTPSGRVVILDFGLVTDADRRAQLSQQSIVGTVDYMAPEQAAGLPVGPPADFYALGVLLYEALTGTVPFFGSPR
jgi:serine/threonine protein kinase